MDVDALRTSLYVFFADYKDRLETVLFQGLYGTLDAVGRKTADFLRSREISETNCRKFGVDHTTLEWLFSKNYLTNLSEEQEHRLFVRHASKFHRDALGAVSPSFALIPSYECNLRCFYCFQGHTLHEDTRVISDEMVYLVFGAISRFLAHACCSQRSSNKIFVKLWGGEPLLRKNRSVVENIVACCRQDGYFLKAITNGTELDAYFDLLGAEGISEIQITIDGPREVHDMRRTDSQGGPTFDIITQNVAEALRRKVDIELRINVDQSNTQGLAALNEYILTQGWNAFPNFHVYSANITPSAAAASSGFIRSSRLLRVLNDEKSNCSLICGPGKGIESAVKMFFKTGSVPLQRTSYCSANVSYYVLDLFGDIYACENEAGQRHKRVGTFGSGELVLDSDQCNNWHTRTVANIPQCSRCPAALLCGGGCGYNAALKSETYFSAYCDGFKSNLAQILPVAYDKYKPAEAGNGREYL